MHSHARDFYCVILCWICWFASKREHNLGGGGIKATHNHSSIVSLGFLSLAPSLPPCRSYHFIILKTVGELTYTRTYVLKNVIMSTQVKTFDKYLKFLTLAKKASKGLLFLRNLILTPTPTCISVIPSTCAKSKLWSPLSKLSNTP